MPLTDLNSSGDPPEGIHQAPLDHVVARFGISSVERQSASRRLVQLWRLARATGHRERLFVWGSFVRAKPDPRDVDVFLVMSEEFNVASLTGDVRAVFSHTEAESRFGASVFWVRRATSPAILEALLAGWQPTRTNTRRGIVEVIE